MKESICESCKKKFQYKPKISVWGAPYFCSTQCRIESVRMKGTYA